MKTEDIAKARGVVGKLEVLHGHISPAILNSMLDEIEALSARAEKAERERDAERRLRKARSALDAARCVGDIVAAITAKDEIATASKALTALGADL